MTRKKIRDIIEFIKTNHHIPMSYWSRCYKKFTSVANSPYEKLRAIFLDAINASGGVVNLNDKFIAHEDFSRKISQFKGKNKIYFNTFCNAIIGNDQFEKIHEDSGELIKSLCIALDGFKQIGQKKAAMLIKYLVLIAKDDIFINLNSEDFTEFLPVPIDRVVKDLCKRIFGSHIKDYEIQRIAEDAFPGNPILLDDLWFWGHFSFNKGEIKCCNLAMLKTDPLITEDILTIKLIPKINVFAKLMKK